MPGVRLVCSWSTVTVTFAFPKWSMTSWRVQFPSYVNLNVACTVWPGFS